MIGLPFSLEDLSRIAWQSYPGRCEQAVTALALGCAADAGRELERFRWCRDRLGKAPPAAPGQNLLGDFGQAMVGATPLIMEFVLTYAGQGPRGFAYLTQGRPSGTLPQSLAGLLAGTLQLLVEGGAARADDAALVVDLFRLAFPNLAGLREHSPVAQGMIVGVVPGEPLAFKLYFNTRLDPSGDHERRVRELLARCDIDDQGMYEALYAHDGAARFQGIGIDLDSDARRAKLYVRVGKDAVAGTLDRLASRLGGGLVAAGQAMLTALASKALLDEVELAVGLRPGEPLTLKLTVFYAARLITASDLERLDSYLAANQYSPELLHRTIDALAAGVDKPVVQAHPLHGVGIELPVGPRPKLNIYLQPVL